jgi:ABC-type transport system involved in multi-copper enzyme maturation permease subunit
MIWTIAKNTYYQHMISFRFLVCFILILALTNLCILFRSILYMELIQNYHTAVANSSDELKKIEALSFLQPTVHRLSQPGSILVKGLSDQLGTQVTIYQHTIPVHAVGESKKNQFAAVFRSFDLPSVVTLVMGLLALLISYDAVSGDKEKFLLALSLSNALPRHQLLLGKYLGGALLLIFSLIIALITNVLIGPVLCGVPLTVSLLFRILSIYIVSFIFLSLMLLISILASVMTHQSFNTLIVLLFLWISFVFIIPKVGNYTSQQVVPVKSIQAVESQTRQLKSEMDKKVDVYRKTIHPQRSWASLMNRDEQGFMLTVHGNPPETVAYYRKLFAYEGPLSLEYAERIWQIEKERIDGLKKQQQWASILSALSPVSIYQQVVMSLAGTDLSHHERFMEETRNYRLEILNYIRSQGGFSSDRYFMQYDFQPSAEEMKLYQKFAATIEQYRSSEEEDKGKIMQQMMQFRQQMNEYYQVHPLEKRKLDLSGMPEFHPRSESLAHDLNDAVIQIGLLLFLNVLCFITAHVLFLRYDVR